MFGFVKRFKDWIVTPRRKITNLAVGLGHAGGALSCWVLAEATFARWSPNAWVFASFLTIAMIAGFSAYDLKRYPNAQLDTALDALEYSAFVILLVPVFTPIAAAAWLVGVFGTVQLIRYNTEGPVRTIEEAKVAAAWWEAKQRFGIATEPSAAMLDDQEVIRFLTEQLANG